MINKSYLEQNNHEFHTGDNQYKKVKRLFSMYIPTCLTCSQTDPCLNFHGGTDIRFGGVNKHSNAIPVHSYIPDKYFNCRVCREYCAGCTNNPPGFGIIENAFNHWSRHLLFYCKRLQRKWRDYRESHR